MARSTARRRRGSSRRWPRATGRSTWSTRATASTISGLAADDVVEIPARVGEQGPLPLPQRPLAPELLGLVAHVAAYERLAVEAAVTGSRRVARRALLAHPLDRAMGHGRAAPGGAARRDRGGTTVTAAIVLAVDGGNSKTDLALVRADGALLAMARGPLSSPHHVGLDGCLRVLEELLAEATAAAGLPAEQPVGRGRPRAARRRRPAGRGACAARRDQRARLGGAHRRSATTPSRSCAPAPSAGGESPWCAAPASTASGWRPTAATCASPRWGRSPATGAAATTSGWRRSSAAARSEDGRGPRTTLEARVPGALRAATPQASSPRRSTSAGSRRGACSSWRRWSWPRRRSTRWRPRSSIASPPRSSPSRAWR